jgi:hypothetical protein
MNCPTTSEEEIEKALLKTAKTVTLACDDLPILARLEFARNLVFGRGGDKDSNPDPVLLVATGVLTGVIEVLKKHSSAANLRRPEP